MELRIPSLFRENQGCHVISSGQGLQAGLRLPRAVPRDALCLVRQFGCSVGWQMETTRRQQHAGDTLTVKGFSCPLKRLVVA